MTQDPDLLQLRDLHAMALLPVHNNQASPPFCYICSGDRGPVYHHHSSSREIRIVQGVDRLDTQHYMCITCKAVH